MIPLITCEHGGSQIPPSFQSLFASTRAQKDLSSHRGYDRGALSIAKSLAERLSAGITFSKISRLLVELNRSLDHPQLYSRYTGGLPKAIKKQILEEHYFPYRQKVEASISDSVASGESVLHLSMHTFTRRFRGILRGVDVGVLYDPNRLREASFSSKLVDRLSDSTPRLRIRHNEPYQGCDDGFTTYLRTKFAAESYLGIEIEVCNDFSQWQGVRKNEWITKFADAIKQSTLPRSVLFNKY
ncbi:N-formylglutamate amidohydrolase [Novipirellula aureliae]|uniref:N-formylglutamate amidohydrolase n=1 Tax=Novipirellula aureliae TaxID=2527966 RepID=UPI0018CD842E|nr:N-formylglutamate amidohydrolase [Novipirellula aureliae]